MVVGEVGVDWVMVRDDGMVVVGGHLRPPFIYFFCQEIFVGGPVGHSGRCVA